MRVKCRAWEPNGTGQGRGQKIILVPCQGGNHLLSRSQSGACIKGLGDAQPTRSDNSESAPTAGMEPSWQELSLWSRLQCDVLLLPEFSTYPPGKELLRVGSLLNHRCLRVRMTQGLTTLKIRYIKKNDRSTDEAGDEKQKD